MSSPAGPGGLPAAPHFSVTWRLRDAGSSNRATIDASIGMSRAQGLLAAALLRRTMCTDLKSELHIQSSNIRQILYKFQHTSFGGSLLRKDSRISAPLVGSGPFAATRRSVGMRTKPAESLLWDRQWRALIPESDWRKREASRPTVAKRSARSADKGTMHFRPFPGSSVSIAVSRMLSITRSTFVAAITTQAEGLGSELIGGGGSRA